MHTPGRRVALSLLKRVIVRVLLVQPERELKKLLTREMFTMALVYIADLHTFFHYDDALDGFLVVRFSASFGQTKQSNVPYQINLLNIIKNMVIDTLLDSGEVALLCDA